MSDSGDSEDIGYMAAQSSDHDPELEDDSHDEDDGVNVDDGDESDSASEGLSVSNEFFDLEAADSDDDASSSSDSGTDQDDDELDSHFFPQFKRLPFELRYSIWEFFCPDLTAKPRVLWFNLNQRHRRDGSKFPVPVEGPFLDQQTRPARAMSAVHRESRQLIRTVLPDTLSFSSKAVVWFNAERDIVHLTSRYSSTVMDLDAMPRLPGFGEHILHLAVDPMNLFLLKWRAPGPAKAFENLRAVYYVTDPSNHKRRHLGWCFSDLAKRYIVDTFEEQPGLGEDGQHVYCWPDTRKLGEVDDDTEVPLQGLINDLVTAGFSADARVANFNGAPVWPLVRFLWDSHPRRLEDLKTESDAESGTGESSGSERSDEEPNEYESEGIDDSIIEDDDSESSDDELLVVPLADGDDSGQSERDGDGSSLVPSSPRPEGYMEDGAIDLTADDDGDMAQFSSPEPPSSETLRGSYNSSHESDSDQPAVRTSRLKRPRVRVVDSDSEDDLDDAGPRKRARTNNRRNPIVLSSDDEEDEREIMRTNRRARTVISEDEDDEDDEDGEEGTSSTDDARVKKNVSSSTSSSEEEDDPEESEESDGGAAVGRPLSLAEKLQLHRENHPIPPSEDEDSEIEGMGGDGYDIRDYADFQDDEEGNEIADDDDDGDDQYGLIEDEFDGEDDGY